jgi:hypothetical protein
LKEGTTNPAGPPILAGLNDRTPNPGWLLEQPPETLMWMSVEFVIQLYNKDQLLGGSSLIQFLIRNPLGVYFLLTYFVVIVFERKVQAVIILGIQGGMILGRQGQIVLTNQ